MQDATFADKLRFEVKNGSFKMDNKKDAADCLKSLPNGVYFLNPTKITNRRTAAQNSRLWRLYGLVADWFNHNENIIDADDYFPIQMTAEHVHLWAKSKFSHLLPKKSIILPDGELLEFEQTTTKLSKSDWDTKPYSDYFDAVASFFQDRCNNDLDF